MSCLIIEIGNRTIKAAHADGIVIGKRYRFRGDRRMDLLLSMMRKERPFVSVVASRNIISKEDLQRLMKFCPDILVIDPDHTYIMEHYCLPVGLSYGRVAAVVASRYLFRGSPCTIINTGHTREVDYLDEHGEYEGGLSGTKFELESAISSKSGNTIVFAGAEANNLGKRMKNSIFAVCNLILMGMALIIDDYVKRDDI